MSVLQKNKPSAHHDTSHVELGRNVLFHQGCALEKNGLFDQLLQVISFTGKTAGDEGSAHGDGQGNRVEGNVLVPLRRQGVFHGEVRCWGTLPLCPD